MKEYFEKGFGFMAGLYTALVVMKVIDNKLPAKYKICKAKNNK